MPAVLSILSEYLRASPSHFPATTYHVSSSCERLSSRSPKRRYLFSGWAAAGPSRDSIDDAPRVAVWQQPVAVCPSWSASRCNSIARSMVPRILSRIHRTSDPSMATDGTKAVMMTFQQLAGGNRAPSALCAGGTGP